MNKFLIFILAICAVSSCKLREIPVDDVYAAVVGIFKGLAETEAATCAGVLTKNKAQILEIVNTAIAEIKAGTAVETAIQNAALKLMGIDGLVSECNVLSMPAIITKFTTEEGLVEVFQALIDNIHEVFTYGQKIPDAIKNKDYPTVGEALGHILAIALDFHVNL
jgi:hypothetical protein